MSSKFSLILVSIISLLFLGACQNKDSQNVYGYDFNTANIKYEITGSSYGTSEVWIKGENKKIHNQITNESLDGSKQIINTILIQKKDKLYTLDVDKKSGYLTTQPMYQELKNMPPEERKNALTADIIRDMRSPEEKAENPLKPEKSEVIAGKTCDLYISSAMLQTCVWQGIPLKAIASLPEYGIHTETLAQSIELNIDIPDSEFDIPQDYQINEIN